MLSTLATHSARPCPVRTTCARTHAHAPSRHVAAHTSRSSGVTLTRPRVLHATPFVWQRPVPRRSRTHAWRPQPRRHAADHRNDDLQAGLDEDDPAADRLHECAEAETNA